MRYHWSPIPRLPQEFRTMSDPVVAGRAPIGTDVEAGKTYYWCTCGKSANQPFCDGAHKGTGFAPQAYTATTTGKVWFCACKQTKNSPLCDGAHKQLPPA
jgi:CDGSH-type Zn-finger protein